ncbi:MAG: nucleoside deaminase [Clostridiales bacterium]|jgi:tRNA(adenine34) deaminase|nr:nucleoside deaminase [Clostridiales bacterium]
MDDVFFMEEAYKSALLARALGEAPIGCVITLNGEIIGRGHNLRNTRRNSLAHAEIIAINEACAAVGDWRLEGAALYVTVEPCPMCAGAIIQARIKRLVFGARNKKAGCAGSLANLMSGAGFNHEAEALGGVLEEKCGELMSGFFRELREKRRQV